MEGLVSQSINQSISQLMILLIMNNLINDSSEKTLSLRPFTQPHLARICDRLVVGHFSAVYSPNKIGRLCGFVSTKSFCHVCLTSVVFCSIIGGQSASLSNSCSRYPFSQASLPFIQSTNFYFRAWITSSVIFLSSPLSFPSVYFVLFSQNKSIFDYEIDISIR